MKTKPKKSSKLRAIQKKRLTKTIKESQDIFPIMTEVSCPRGDSGGRC